MNKTLKFILAVFAALLLSALLTPVFYSLLNPLSPFFKFERIFNRLITVFVLLAALLFVRFHKDSWSKYGFNFSVPWRTLFISGFLYGTFLIFFITIAEAAFGPRYVRESMFVSDILQRFLKGLLTGTAVGITEEFFFRGFIFVHLERTFKTWPAIVVTSVFYSLVHFLNNGQIFIPTPPSLVDAFRLLFGFLEPITHRPLVILPEFIGLFLFGLVLSFAFVRTRSLFLSIGIHAGVVFFIKWQNSFFRKGPEIYHPLYGSTPHYDGIFEWFVLVLLCFFIYWKTRSTRQIRTS